ncbi:hypothetical protein M413DRAFT_445050 [Hebeloma cylindrosporum]|uniref:Enoyl reductase (ER) domain-containing protein n=1 Tax=Hebeloma cylindrosporum TaxID=76867 RepID=A0A0C3CC68_HEBCY|nr:hypothetical protein M413DRAFT_445050 [Hebeloma cylindrosporum h7]
MHPLPTKTRQYVLPKPGTYKTLNIREAEVVKPRATEVLVKVHAVSLQARDLNLALGIYPLSATSLVPCSDMAGEIIATGDDVRDWKIGDRVCSNFATDYIYGDFTSLTMQTSLGGQSPGVLTEYRTFPAHALVSIPDHLTYEEASTLPCAALTAYNALNGPTPLKAGDTVLVQGTGGVSIFGLQFAVASGATVIATSSSNEKLKSARKLGATHTINYKENPNWEEEVLKITNGVGVDHIIEVGGPGTLQKSITAARIGGSIHVIGFLAKGEGSIAGTVSGLVTKCLKVRGICTGSVSLFRDMNKLIVAHPEVTRPVVDRVFAFEDTVRAYEYLDSGEHVGKIVIRVARE